MIKSFPDPWSQEWFIFFLFVGLSTTLFHVFCLFKDVVKHHLIIEEKYLQLKSTVYICDSYKNKYHHYIAKFKVIQL
ncbi:hypothetical protein JCM21142_93467 [Saccharicrinis fermentans DSM 9555 = JCM 21142]|uniref:Uncharacterized protein n=1 Tax=Saccharicrinis fermentans DSM 9555 = JCM 21142 TaxID=869213 RepID=W7Y1H4_9BACT|nr:hypothetical protein JCM21142_93467 [Saccharicrinis fermentans DSM 9555 = JCM 21142]